MVKQGHSIDERKSAALMVKQTTVWVKLQKWKWCSIDQKTTG
jgi:hypothetical protein